MAAKKVRGLRVRNMHNIVDYAIKSKRFIGGLGRLKKDGKIKKINGQVFARKTSKAGNEYILVDNFFGEPRNLDFTSFSLSNRFTVANTV